MIFKDRQDAGLKLAAVLMAYRQAPNTQIIALPRGGVVIGDELAKKLSLPLDIVVPRKIGAPGNEEFAIGAITESGEPILDQGIIKQYQIAEDYLKITIAKEQKEAARRLKLYRGEREPLNLKGQNVIIADDGIATGATMKAAIASVKGRGVKKITIAVPVSSVEASAEIKKLVDEFVCLDTPEYFGAVGAFYESFGQTTDEEVIKIMKNQVSRR